MSLKVTKRKSADYTLGAATEQGPLLQKRAKFRPDRFAENDFEVEKAKRLSAATAEKLDSSARAFPLLECGRFLRALTSQQTEIHELAIQHFQGKKPRCPTFTEKSLQRMCLPNNSTKALKIIDIPELGKGVFLSRSAKPIEKGRVLGIYEGEIQVIYQYQNETTSRYKWTLFDFDLESEDGIDPALKGWSEVVDGEIRRNFSAFVNACHPDHPEEANVEPRICLLKALDGSKTLQILYVASQKISEGEQLLVNYNWPYFENSGLSPLRITPTTYRLDDKDLLTFIKPEFSEDGATSSSSSSRKKSFLIPLLEESYIDLTRDEEELSSSPTPFSSSSSTQPSSRSSSSLPKDADDYKEEPSIPAQLPDASSWSSAPPPQALPALTLSSWSSAPLPPQAHPALTLSSWSSAPPSYAHPAMVLSSLPPYAQPVSFLPPPRNVLPAPIASSANVLQSSARRPYVRHPILPWALPQATAQVTTPRLTKEEVSQRIEKIKAFLRALNLVCEREVEELRAALSSLVFPESLFSTFFNKIRDAVSLPDSVSDKEIARKSALVLREKLHYFIKILWGKEEETASCFELLYSEGAPLWWTQTHGYFVKIFTKLENCHRPSVNYA